MFQQCTVYSRYILSKENCRHHNNDAMKDECYLLYSNGVLIIQHVYNVLNLMHYIKLSTQTGWACPNWKLRVPEVWLLTCCVEHLVLDNQQIGAEGVSVVLACVILASQVEQHLKYDKTIRFWIMLYCCIRTQYVRSKLIWSVSWACFLCLHSILSFLAASLALSRA